MLPKTFMLCLKIACFVKFSVLNIVLIFLLLIFIFLYDYANTLKPMYINTLFTLYKQSLHKTTTNNHNISNALYQFLQYIFTFISLYFLHHIQIYITSTYLWFHPRGTDIIGIDRISVCQVSLIALATIHPSLHSLILIGFHTCSIKKITTRYHTCLFTLCLYKIVIDITDELGIEYLMTPQSGTPIKKLFNSG